MADYQYNPVQDFIEILDGELYIVCAQEGAKFQNSRVKVADIIGLLKRVEQLETDLYLLTDRKGEKNG